MTFYIATLLNVHCNYFNLCMMLCVGWCFIGISTYPTESLAATYGAISAASAEAPSCLCAR